MGLPTGKQQGAVKQTEERELPIKGGDWVYKGVQTILLRARSEGLYWVTQATPTALRVEQTLGIILTIAIEK